MDGQIDRQSDITYLERVRENWIEQDTHTHTQRDRQIDRRRETNMVRRKKITARHWTTRSGKDEQIEKDSKATNLAIPQQPQKCFFFGLFQS